MTPLTEQEILERVDEYTLYCHYLGYEPDFGVSYSSPFRQDENPSFGIFKPRKYPNRELMWKDISRGWSGDIFELVKRLYPMCVSKTDAARIICSDFNIGIHIDNGPRIVEHVIKPRANTDIAVKSRQWDKEDLKYWQQFNISLPTLERYQVNPLMYYWMTKDQKAPFYPSSRAYSYRIWDKYTLYFPFERKGRKFKNDLSDIHLPGLIQLKFKHPLLIITKATKDIMMFDSFGYEAVAGRGENIALPEEYVQELEKRYEKIVLWRDNDGKNDDDKYLYDKLYVPVESGQKDPSDFCKTYGPKETLLLIKNLTGYDPIN